MASTTRGRRPKAIIVAFCRARSSMAMLVALKAISTATSSTMASTTRSTWTGDLGAEPDVLDRRQPREEVEALEHEAHRVAPQPAALPARGVGHVAAGQPDPSAAGRVEQPDHVEQGRLAAARGAEDDDERVVGDVQVDADERVDTDLADAVALADVVEVDARPARSSRRRRGAGSQLRRGGSSHGYGMATTTRTMASATTSASTASGHHDSR
jgi:hypothetical protein